MLHDFSMLPVKEIHYFDRDIRYPSPNWLSESSFSRRLCNQDWLAREAKFLLRSFKQRRPERQKFLMKKFFASYSDEWYLSLFGAGRGLKGEISPSYSILDRVDIQKMYVLAPEARLVLLVRNPVERAWSQVRHQFGTNIPDDETVIEFIDSPRQELRSDYRRTIENYAAVYPHEQIIIAFFDDIVAAPNELLLQITSFISQCSERSNTANQSKVTVLPPSVANPRPQLCPPAVVNHLKKKYFQPMIGLSEEYGGYFSHWVNATFDSHLDIPKASSTLALSKI